MKVENVNILVLEKAIHQAVREQLPDVYPSIETDDKLRESDRQAWLEVALYANKK